MVVTTNPATPTWSAPIDVNVFNTLHATRCVSETSCLAVDDAGHILHSSNPTAVAPVWTPTGVAGAWKDIDCVGTSLCVAVDNGLVATTTNPAADAPTWNRRSIPAGDLVSVSCPSTSFCDAVTADGSTAFSTDPGSATAMWFPRQNPVAPAPATGSVQAIACASSSLCIFGDQSATVFATTNPASDLPTWTNTPIGGAALTDVACPAPTLCIAAAADLKTASSANAGAATPVWSAPAASGISELGCLSTTFCVGFDDGAVATSISPPAAWSAPVPIGSGPGLTDVSCAPTQTVCVAVDTVGQVIHGVAAPENSGVPTVAGTAEIGQTLTATAGTWSAAPALTYQWMRCDGGGSGCAPIGGATAATYTVAADDATHTLRVQETATNGGGTATADSAATGAVPSPPGPGGGAGAGAGRHDAARRDAAGEDRSQRAQAAAAPRAGAYGQGGEARQPA